MPDEVTLRVFRLIAELKKIPQESITIDSTFEQLGLDSLDSINLLYEVEGEFNISVPDDLAKSIEDVRHLVEALKAAGADSSLHTPADQ